MQDLKEQVAAVAKIAAWPVHTVVTHFGPQVDEYLAWWLAHRFGGEKWFPGIRRARLMLVDAGTFTPENKPVNSLETIGYLPLGVWGGRFDEHRLPLKEQTDGTCAATLMAEYLGVHTDEALAELLKFVGRNDSKGASTPFDLATIAKDLNNYFEFQGRMAIKHGKTFSSESQTDRVRNMLFTIFDAKYSQGREFMKAVDEVKNTAKKHSPPVELTSVDCADGQERLLAVARSYNRQMNRALRTLRPRPDVVIQRRGNGQVAIFATGSVPLDGVYRTFLAEEAQRGELTKQQAERRWCYFNRNNANQLLNGGLSAPGVPATCLSLGFIKGAVIDALRNYVASKR